MDDEQLIAAAARGDRDAFAALYRRRRPDVYRFALHMTGSPAAAEDIAQDVFMAVITHTTRYEPGRAAVVPWLLGIARNHARRWLSRRRYDPLSAGADAAAGGDDPSRPLLRSQETAMVRRALCGLPVPYREAVVLCDLQELSYEDAAAAAGCAVGTVRSRLHRGRALLSAHLRGERRAFAGWPATDWIA